MGPDRYFDILWTPPLIHAHTHKQSGTKQIRLAEQVNLRSQPSKRGLGPGGPSSLLSQYINYKDIINLNKSLESRWTLTTAGVVTMTVTAEKKIDKGRRAQHTTSPRATQVIIPKVWPTKPPSNWPTE